MIASVAEWAFLEFSLRKEVKQLRVHSIYSPRVLRGFSLIHADESGSVSERMICDALIKAFQAAIGVHRLKYTYLLKMLLNCVPVTQVISAKLLDISKLNLG